MRRSEIHTYKLENGSYQRVQAVYADSWAQTEFLRPEFSLKAFQRLCALYRDFTVPAYRKIFGKVILYTLPEDLAVPFTANEKRDGRIYDRLATVTSVFRNSIKVRKGKLVFKDPDVKEFFAGLQKRGYLEIAEGDRPAVQLIPVGQTAGLLEETEPEAYFKMNASFFTMDYFDLPSVYDRSGTVIGLCVKDGHIWNPPQFGRECFTVYKNGKVCVTDCSLKDLGVVVDGTEYRHGVNAEFYERPAARKTPKGGYDYIITGNRVTARKDGGEAVIPAGGFVLHLDRIPGVLKDFEVTYRGLEDVAFGIQGGNSTVRNGKAVTGFISPFYDFRRRWETPYPPTFYPLKYEKDRAPRIVLGADREGLPVFLWMEGAPKFGYDAKTDSSGVTLKEAAELSKALGIVNGIHLDGGGSAEILTEGKRALKISDRDPQTLEEIERGIPMGLMIRTDSGKE